MNRFLLLSAIIILTVTILPAQVAINTDGSTPDNSAMLDVKSTDKGLLPPRLTTAARNTLTASAVAGLMVYDINLNKFFYFNGTIWEEGSVGGSLWGSLGSSTYLKNLTNYVGIGTATPGNDLDIHRITTSSFIRAKSDESYAGMIIDKGETADNGYLIHRTAGAGTWYVGTIGNDDYTISKSYFTGGDGKFYINSTGQVGIGTITPATGYKLSVDGKIICEELRVDLSTGWPDYVFAEDYKLMSLPELETYIAANGHLPNIPAAEEIKESGLEVGEMQRLMMEKIEELSLYIIEQQKTANLQQKEIEELKKQINKNQN